MKYGCIAEKLGHSYSKIIHSQFADYDYELFEIEPNSLDSFMKKREFCAINVTIPYKQAVIPYLDEISEIAEKIGAVNTVLNKGGKLCGYNTDFFGMKSLILKSGISLHKKKALILGNGGTAKTATAVLKDLGAYEIFPVSRKKQDGCITYDEALKNYTDTQIIINTTPLGMFPNIGVSAINLENFPKLEGVIDAVYNPLRTKLICDAQFLGINATGGLYMLVAQAAKACELFTNTKISDEKIDAVFNKISKEVENIVLIGMPGAGKTTIGKEISKILNKDFVDTDDEIVKEYGMTIPEIFSQKGETFFRDIEANVIKRVSSLKNTVIATGGGAILRKENVMLLRENGKIYFIDRPLESIRPTDDRPTAYNREVLKKRYAERYPIYKTSCDACICVSDSVKENAEKIVKDFLK